MDGSLLLPMLLAIGVSLSVSLLATPLCYKLARRCGIVDRPDGKRKLQLTPIALLGGVAVCLGIVGGIGAIWKSDGFSSAGSKPLGLVAGLVLICLVGVYDDVWNIRARYKLLAQVLCTLPLVFSGCVIERLGFCGYTLELGAWSVPFSILWLVSGINAINVIDGMDGLATTVGLSIAAGIGMVGAISGAGDCVMLATVMAAALAGFLLFNLPPARVYLGDAGSMTIGMALSALALQVATDAAGRSSLTLMVVLLAVPLGDLTLAVIRRSLSGCGICSPDRGHIHHRLLERGFSVPGALGVAATITLISGAIASASRLVGWEPLAWACLVVMAVGLVRSRLAGHIEWAMTKNKFAGHWPRPTLALPTQEQIATLPFDEVWGRLVASADRLSLQGVELSLHDAHGALGTSSNNRLHRWHSAAHAAPATSPSSVEIVMFTIRAETVRLRLEPEGDTAPSGPAWQSLLKAARLAVAHWAESPQSVPAVDTQQTTTPLAGEAPVIRWTRAA